MLYTVVYILLPVNVIRRLAKRKMTSERLKELWIELKIPDNGSLPLHHGGFYTLVLYRRASMVKSRGLTDFPDRHPF